jgi:hypothetical protein
VSHPQFSQLIWAWWKRSEEMIGGVDSGSVEILRAVRETGVPCYALTNMEAETYPLRLERFPFSRLVRRYRRLRSGRHGETGSWRLHAATRSFRIEAENDIDD